MRTRTHRVRAYARRPTRQCRARDALSCFSPPLPPAHSPPLSLSLACMRKTIFGIQAASRVYTLEEKRWNVGITRAMRACVRTYIRVRGGVTRTRPAFDCILRIYSGGRVYARNACDVPSFSSSFPSFLPFFPPADRCRAFRIAIDASRRVRLINTELRPSRRNVSSQRRGDEKQIAMKSERHPRDRARAHSEV